MCMEIISYHLRSISAVDTEDFDTRAVSTGHEEVISVYQTTRSLLFVFHVYAVNVVHLFARYLKKCRDVIIILILNVTIFAMTLRCKYRLFYARLFKTSKGKLLQN